MSSQFTFSLDTVLVPHIRTQHREILTSIPCDGTRDIVEQLEKVEYRSMHGQIPLVWDKALDYNIFDQAGNKWIDFTSTIFVANVGHSNPRVLERIEEELSRPLLGCYAYPNQTRARYLEALIDFAGKPFEKAFLLSAGTETTEAAIKLMRLNGRKVGKKKGGIISFSGNWHGRTLGAQQLSDNTKQRDWIFSPDLDIHFLPFPYPWEVNEENGREFFLESLKKLEFAGVNLEEDICGFMLETFQGWGAFFYPKSFVQAVREVSLNLAALMCFDEMQAGFARTGKKFGFEHYEVSPDLICCGKGMGAGLPLSGVIGRAEIMDLPEVGNMSSTHSGNPVVCAAGLAVLEEISSKELVQASLVKGQVLESLLRDLIEKFPNILRETYGHGLIRSLIFQSDSHDKSASLYASTFSELCFRRGVLVVHTGRESVKLGPPLTIPLEAIIEACAVMESVLQGL